MNLKIIPITEQNLDEAKKISVFNYQRGYIETVEECLKEASVIKDWCPVCLCDGDNIIGFAMYGYICEKEYIELWDTFLKDKNEKDNPYMNKGNYEGNISRLWLDRFMIDKNYQGKGYARPVIKFLIDNLNKEYKGKDIYLSVYDDNPIAIKLYKEFGFEFIGEFDLNGEKIMRLIIK